MRYIFSLRKLATLLEGKSFAEATRQYAADEMQPSSRVDLFPSCKTFFASKNANWIFSNDAGLMYIWFTVQVLEPEARELLAKVEPIAHHYDVKINSTGNEGR